MTNLSLSEWVLVAQTFVLAITAGIIVWYTIETARIRRETSRQATLLAEQLRLSQAQHEYGLRRESSIVSPVFEIKQSRIDSGMVYFRLANRGAAIRDLTQEDERENVQATPHQYVGTGTEFTVRVTRPRDGSERIDFTLGYTDGLDTRRQARFRYTPATNKLTEITGEG